jgi:hypothetical protein
MMTCAEKTQYKKIYEKTYWGNFNYNDFTLNKIAFDDILNNRNNFIKSYGIKDIAEKIPGFIQEKYNKNGYKFDHVEIYRSNDKKYIVINSPYCISENDEKNLLLDGWKKIYNLYSNMATTYIKVFNPKAK